MSARGWSRLLYTYRIAHRARLLLYVGWNASGRVQVLDCGGKIEGLQRTVHKVCLLFHPGDFTAKGVQGETHATTAQQEYSSTE